MRKALLATILLAGVAALVLATTVFGGQSVDAATTPFQQVLVQNPSTSPVPVQQVGTSATSVSGTVGIDSSKNTVSLDSTDSTNLANVAGHLKNLDTPTKSLCTPYQDLGSQSDSWVCTTSGTWDISNLVATGMDDDVIVSVFLNDDVVLELPGSDDDGTSNYQLQFPRPIRANRIGVTCDNQVEDCRFVLNVVGTVNP